jgi:hypothetical protein
MKTKKQTTKQIKAEPKKTKLIKGSKMDQMRDRCTSFF